MYGHPSPEEVFAAVKQRIPSISLATVYKNIHLFVESGVFRELSIHHGTLRVEMNKHPHHHMVCSICKKVADLPDDELTLQTSQTVLPGGFLIERISVDVIGICPDCQRLLSASYFPDFLRSHFCRVSSNAVSVACCASP
jgi:Fur family peroxide stress response transcriptional regulator